ncbi:MAG: hypothetical protein GC172_03970 [Phycisphaera sp.]|nr:hypothetical protein [Phycisphaera sp.]
MPAVTTVHASVLILAGFLAGFLAPSEAALAQVCPACEEATVVDVGDTPFVGSATGCLIPADQGGCLLPSYNTFFFSFTPAQTGLYRVSTCTDAPPSAGLTVLSVWADCSGFSLVQCGIAGCPSGNADGSFIGDIELFQGVNYRIGVGSGGCCSDVFIESGTLSIEPIDPAGSGCKEATPAVLGLNAYDTTDRNEIVDLAGFCEPAPVGEPFDRRIHNAQYFRFTPPATDVYTISTCGQGEQIWERIAVMAGCSPADGVVACSDSGCYTNDDNAGSTIVGVLLEGGVEYTIIIGGVYGSQSGTGAFMIAPFEACPAPKPTVQELEACGADENAGCVGSPKSAEPIVLGDSVRGTIWASGGLRDSDWYRIELDEGTNLTLELNSRIPSFATIYFSNCTTSLFMDQTAGVCPGLTDGECLPAGVYYIVVAPYELSGFPCGYAAGNEYTLTVSGRPCDASPPPNDLCIDAIEVSEGAMAFDNYFAGGEIDFKTCALIGRDVWFSFTATKAGDYRFSVCNGSTPFNSGMDLWTACPVEGGEVVACNRDANDPNCGNSSYSAIILPMTADQTVLVRIGSEWFLDILPPGDAELIITALGDEIVCGDPDAGDCCVARGQPFCSDAECCNFICLVDPPCCDTAWDETCAAGAALFCFSQCGLPPGNDDCSSPLPAEVGANAFRNARAEGSTPTPCGTVHSDVWFEYTATTDGPVAISLCAADGGWALVTGGFSGDLDTRIAVFDSCSGSLVACDDNACGVGSRVVFTPSCGATYLVAIGSSGDADGIYSQGVGSFTITETGSCGGVCGADLNGDGEVGAQDLAALLNAWDGAAGDLNDDGTTNAQDLAALLSAWGPCAR